MIRAAIVLLLAAALPVAAHPIVQHAVDVVISRDKVVVDARVSMEQIFLVENGGQPGAQQATPAPSEQWPTMVDRHSAYFLKHLRISADNVVLPGRVVSVKAPAEKAGDAAIGMAAYRIEYALSIPPELVGLGQTFLVDYQWQVGCVVRVRQADQGEWEAAAIAGTQKIEFGCTWTNAPATPPAAPSAAAPLPTHFDTWETARTYYKLGWDHIVAWDPESGRPRGLDHILFVCALVLVVRSMWDLLAVVTTFTLAHTLTLALSAVGWLDWLHVPERVVEGMITGSIVAVALHNVIWPSTTRGRARLAIAFAFGLFHGLGFAGELRGAMSEMPASAVATALVSFGAGVEVGHQLVVLPLFVLLLAARRWGRPADAPRAWVGRWAVPVASLAIAAAGAWFFWDAVLG
ncbi:MAG TPA: HupE/UreJ family protein [Tepidisphaeraceae bacterium]|nr:HupE/UreJ family protein [Tepidisphaeraceae bacterium]